MQGIQMTTEEFIIKGNEIHNNLYTYPRTKYINAKSCVVITCSVHGDFLQMPTNHLSGKGCKKCAVDAQAKLRRARTKESFTERANQIHNNRYDYSKTICDGITNKVIIICSKHGEFLQKADGHLSGRGCYACANENRGFRRTAWVNTAKGRNGILYVINCKNDTESFIKIGITLMGVEKRFPRGILMPYDYNIISTIEDTPYNIFNKEIELKRKLKTFKYSPIIAFDGAVLECFSMESLNTIKQFLNEHSSNNQ